jgi:hypothetical protein
MPTWTCPKCGKRLSAMTREILSLLIETHVREHWGGGP